MYFLYKKFLFETNRNMLKLFIINKKIYTILLKTVYTTTNRGKYLQAKASRLRPFRKLIGSMEYLIFIE